MVSNVNPNFITAAPVSKAGMKGQLQIIKDEITALQAASTLIGTNFTQFGTGAVSRTWLAKMREVMLSSGDFGADPTGVADSQPALQALFTAAGAQGRIAHINNGTYRVNAPLVLPQGALGLIMDGRIIYHGTDIALTIGSDGNTSRVQFRWYEGIDIQRNTITDWTSEDEIGLLARNLDNCYLEVRRIAGFTIGLRTLGAALDSANAHGFEDNVIKFGQVVNCRICVDVRTDGQFSWNNAVRYIGGHFTNASTTNPTLNRFGVRLSREDTVSYNLHNAHVFYGPMFELQRQGTPPTVDAIPFLLQVAGRALIAHDIRMEACSPFVARHDADFNDALYEVGFVGTYGFHGCVVDYTSNANRAGGSVRTQHQSLSAWATPRLVAAADNVRASAFQHTVDAAGGIGFDNMAITSSNPTSSPTTMNTLLFGGLGLLTLNAEDVTIPTSRALGFCMDLRSINAQHGILKELFIAAEGVDLRPVVMQFNSSETVLDDTSPIRFSNGNAVWAGTPSYWWELNVSLDTLVGGFPLNSLQRVTLHPNAAFAFVGVRGGSATAILRALRLYSAPEFTPRLVAGNSRRWGARELTTSVSWNVPTLAPGDTATIDVTLTGVRGGDFCEAAHRKDTGFQNGGVAFFAVQGGTASTNQIRVTARNNSSGSITVGAGTLFVRATRPRV